VRRDLESRALAVPRPGLLISARMPGPQAAKAVGAASLSARLREPGSCPLPGLLSPRGSVIGLSVGSQRLGGLACRRY
jgi:hypothetical protein